MIVSLFGIILYSKIQVIFLSCYIVVKVFWEWVINECIYEMRIRSITLS